LNVQANPVQFNSLKVDDASTGSDLGPTGNDPRNDNRKVAFWATSSEDGVTPVAVYCDEDGLLLIDSN
jgi:hypothetical protein